MDVFARKGEWYVLFDGPQTSVKEATKIKTPTKTPLIFHSEAIGFFQQVSLHVSYQMFLCARLLFRNTPGSERLLEIHFRSRNMFGRSGGEALITF
jgi:hypothetical protein